MKKVQLTINIDAETKQRVEAAAAEEKVSVNEFLLIAVQRQLADGKLISAYSPKNQEEFIQLMKDIRTHRESILAGRNGQLLDVDEEIEQTRSERDAELYDLY